MVCISSIFSGAGWATLSSPTGIDTVSAWGRLSSNFPSLLELSTLTAGAWSTVFRPSSLTATSEVAEATWSTWLAFSVVEVGSVFIFSAKADAVSTGLSTGLTLTALVGSESWSAWTVGLLARMKKPLATTTDATPTLRRRMDQRV